MRRKFWVISPGADTLALLMAAGAEGGAARAILIVEDDELVATTFARAVRLAGLRPVVSATLGDARPLVSGDLVGVILDVALPDGCGLDFIVTARASSPRVPIIVVTGANNVDVANRANLLDAEYACKPNLQANVAKFLGRCATPSPPLLEELLLEMQTAHGLTVAERRLLGAAVTHSGQAALAETLVISVNTVKKHIASILVKTDELRLDDVLAPLRARAHARGYH